VTTTGLAERSGPRAIGVDAGGTTVKAGVVDLGGGGVLDVVRVPTPVPQRIDDVVETVAAALDQLGDRHAEAGFGDLPLGLGLSGDVRDGRHTTGVNYDPSWVGAPALDLLETRLGRPAWILNDADAAGIGEVRYGAALGVRGVVVVLTFGTFIGSAVLLDGRLLRNSGLGQFPFRGEDVEVNLSAVARERRGISWEQWAGEVSEFLGLVDGMLRPELIVVGGGASEAWPAYQDLLHVSCPVARAGLGSLSGVVGAAAAAAFAGDLGLPSPSRAGT
jgi:polyphosphate glucokinase